MAVQKTSTQKKAEITRAIVDAGYDDVLMLDRETAETVLTDKRLGLLDRISQGDVRSVRSLAVELDRDKGAVSRDLDLLYRYDLVEYDRVDNRKMPKPKHETVVVEPLL